jgi:tRNA1Val (adenine37-N6)-methyltransferase
MLHLMSALDKHELTVKRIKMVHPYVDKEANMVLIEAVRKGKSQVIVEKPLIVYKALNEYHDEIHDIYGY